MKTDHIKNCINKIERDEFNSEWLERYGQEWLDIFEAEIENRLLLRRMR